MKKIIMLAVLGSALFANSAHYKLGFENSIEALQISFKNNGYLPQTFNIKNNYVVYGDIADIDSATLLLMEYLTFKEGFVNVKTTRKFIIYESYERNADALKAKEKVRRILNGISVKVAKKTSFNQKELITYSPYVNDMSNKVINEIQRNNNIVVKREFTEVPVIQEKQRIVYKQAKPKVIYKTPEPKKYISLRNSKAQAYKYKDKTMQELRVMQDIDLEDFEYGGSFNRLGDDYVGVKGQNIYFLKRDIELKAK